MNWKMYDRDILMFAEEGDEDDGDQPNGGGDDDEGSDIDKLRASYDTKLAALQKELDSLKANKGQEDYQSMTDREYKAAVAFVQSQIASAEKEKDPAKALELLKATVQSTVAHNYGLAYAQSKVNDAKLHDAHAESYAARLTSEFGGSTASHKAKLLEARSEAEMKATFLELQLTLSKDKKPRGSQGESRPRIDSGRGGAARTNVLSEMEDIDISTPEGRAKWQEKRGEFRRKLEPASR